MNIKFTPILLIAMGIISVNAFAQITPTLSTIREPDFGEITFKPGSCRLDYDTAALTDLSATNTCPNSSYGTVGRYQIVANSNKQVSVKVLQRDNEGDNLVFIPEGKLVSSIETIIITANVEAQINSGPTGVITLYLGGQLIISQTLTPATEYHVIKEDGIEWSELP